MLGEAEACWEGQRRCWEKVGEQQGENGKACQKVLTDKAPGLPEIANTRGSPGQDLKPPWLLVPRASNGR